MLGHTMGKAPLIIINNVLQSQQNTNVTIKAHVTTCHHLCNTMYVRVQV